MRNKKIISFEASEPLRKAIRAEAYKRDLTVSALIRQVLENELAKDVKETPNKQQ